MLWGILKSAQGLPTIFLIRCLCECGKNPLENPLRENFHTHTGKVSMLLPAQAVCKALTSL